MSNSILNVLESVGLLIIAYLGVADRTFVSLRSLLLPPSSLALARRSSAALGFPRRNFATAPTKNEHQQYTFSEPSLGFVMGAMVVGAGAVLAAGVGAWESVRARSDLEKNKQELQKTLEEIKQQQKKTIDDTFDDTFAGKENVLQAQADSVKAQADSVKAQADSVEKSLRAQADSVKSQAESVEKSLRALADSVKSQAESVKTQAWGAYLGTYVLGGVALAVALKNQGGSGGSIAGAGSGGRAQ